MADFIQCNVCDSPGRLVNTPESAKIFSNVRKFKELSFTVWRCSHCRSLHSKEDVDLDYYYSHYPTKKQTLSYPFRASYFNRMNQLKGRGVTKEGRILDYGCSEGIFVSYLKNKGFTFVEGYDAFVDRYSDKQILGHQYDCITCQDVIEHVESPRDLIHQLASMLNPGGLLAIGTPNAADINLCDSQTYSRELHQPYHRHILSEKALSELGEKIGLHVFDTSRKLYCDTLFPGVNTKFIWGYARRSGGMADVFYEPFHAGILLKSPLLFLYFFVGYFFSPNGNITIFFRKPA